MRSVLVQLLPSKDSLIWTLGLLGSIATALSGPDGANLVPPAYHAHVALAAFVVGVVSAYAKHSPLRAGAPANALPEPGPTGFVPQPK